MSNESIDGSENAGESVVEKIRSLTAKFERVTSDRNGLRADLEESKERESKLRKENVFLQDRLNDQEDRSRDKSEDVSQLEKELLEANSRLKRTEWARQELARYEEHMKDEVAKLRNQLVDVAERRDVLENELSVSQKLVDTLRVERDSLGTQLQEAHASLAELQRKHESASSDLTQSRKEYEALQKEFGSFPPNVREKLQEEFNAARERLSRLEGDCKRFSGRLAEREDELLEKDLEIQALRRQAAKAIP